MLFVPDPYWIWESRGHKTAEDAYAAAVKHNHSLSEQDLISFAAPMLPGHPCQLNERLHGRVNKRQVKDNPDNPREWQVIGWRAPPQIPHHPQWSASSCSPA
jgi:hypothetical protein